jgi:predicted dehydrogenase
MPTTRRGFLSATAAAAAGFTIVPRHVLGGTGHIAPSDKVNVALVGAGGRGRENVRELFKLADVQVIAVADPAERWDLGSFYYKNDAGRAPVCAEVEKHYSEKSPNARCAGYDDFREMLDKEKAIDAVLCATPDHLHAYVTLRALRAGKHVYCEKPLTHNVAEARLVAKVAKESGLATQMGNQLHATDGLRQTVEWIKGGVIGRVISVNVWVGTRRWNPSLTGKPSESMPVPEGLNWDLWLGPREFRPFHRAYAPVAWRDFWAFGSGALGDFGCHDMDSAAWALDLERPTRVEASPAGPTDKEITPYGSIAYYWFGPRGDRPPVSLTWYDGGLKPPFPESLPPGTSLPNRGALFIGDSGTILSSTGNPPRLLRTGGTGEPEPPAPSLPRSKGHHREWIDAIKGGPPALSDFAYGARLTEIALLGVAALRTGKPIELEGDALTARNNPGADAVFHESYRNGWELG